MDGRGISKTLSGVCVAFVLLSVIFDGAVLGQKRDAGSLNKIITSALKAAAAQLDWSGEIEIVRHSPTSLMFMISDKKDRLAITHYPDADSAQKAFASSTVGVAETKFHGYPAFARSDGGSLSWYSEAFVFFVGSKTGEAEKLGNTLAKAAVKSGITPPGPEPAQFFAGGNFESGMQLERGGGMLAKDPINPTNQAVAITTDDFFEKAMTVPADVNSIKVSLRALIPPSVQLEILEKGQPAKGVKIRLRAIDAKGNSGISEWILQPADGWQELSTSIKDIGRCRERFSLEASWFSGTIYYDDIKITSLFPAFLDDGLYESYQTPAQVTYFYVVDPIFSGDNVTRVGSPVITDDKVTIDFDFAGNKENLWFVEKKNNGETAEVVVGPPNAGGDLYRLKKIDGRWAISGIEGGDGI